MEEATRGADSNGLEWENLALYTNKPNMQNNNLHHQFGFSSSSAPNEYNLSHEEAGLSSRADHFGKLGYEDLMRPMPDPIIGLRLGHHASTGGGNSSSSIPVSSTPTPTPTKRSRASYHNMQNPCCQVEGCNLDLKLAKDYHRRHRICESHSKSPKVIVAGMERRFCQQCSRFHDLSEFDDKKRSCRRRLSDHNARRRRVQPESIQLTSPGISPSLYTDQRLQNVLLNGLPISMPWENANTTCSMPRHHHALVRPSKTTLNDDVLHMDPDRLASLHHLSTPRILDHQCISSNSSMAPDVVSGHSLLSSSSWSLNEGDSTSMEGINYSPVMRHSESDNSHNLTLFQTNNIININGLDQVGPTTYMQQQNAAAAASSHHQEYHLFKPPNYHSGNFYSSQRSL